MKFTADDFADWSSYMSCQAPRDLLCVFRQGEAGQPWVGYARDFSPSMYVAELQWKLTGIAREELAGMGLAEQMQRLPVTQFAGVRELANGNGYGGYYQLLQTDSYLSQSFGYSCADSLLALMGKTIQNNN